MDPHYAPSDDPLSDPDTVRALDAYNAALPDAARLSGAACLAMAGAVKLQQRFSRAIDEQAFHTDVSRLDMADQAQLRSEALPGAGDFLDTMPSFELRLAMRPQEFVTEVKRRLLMDVFPG
eukprot:gene3498-5745_t